MDTGEKEFMKISLGLPLWISLFLVTACGNNHQDSRGTDTDTTTATPSAGNSGMSVDDTVRRSDASKTATDTASKKPIGTPEEKIKNLK